MRPAVLLLLGCAACSTQIEEDCERLADELTRCDLPPARLACDRLTTRERRVLIERFEEMSCTAIREGDDDLDLRICDLFGWTCPGPLFDSPAPAPTRHSIVLVGGIEDDATFAWNLRIVEALRAIGPNEVHLVQPAPWSIVEIRAAELSRALESIGAPRVNLICYAVGGLDCRYLASPNGLASDRVASITTIATPHLGTNVANAGLDLSSGDYRAVLEALGAREDPPDDTALQVVLGRLTPEKMRAFNEEITDAPGVLYQSFAGISHIFGQPLVPSEADVSRECRGPDGTLLLARSGDGYDVMSPILAATAPFADAGIGEDAAALLRPSDGMVSIASARWGRFRGCVPADHYDLIGQIGDLGVDPSSGFEATRFYQNLAVDLARRGL